MAKAVVSVTCNACETKYRTTMKKSGKQARVCPSCGSAKSTRNEPDPVDCVEDDEQEQF